MCFQFAWEKTIFLTDIAFCMRLTMNKQFILGVKLNFTDVANSVNGFHMPTHGLTGTQNS